MARPTKSTVDYFPHFVKGGKTLFVLESDFGNDGYAFWFKLLEVLGGTEGMYFDWRNISNRRFLLSKTRVDEDVALQIISTLVDVEAIDRELWERRQVIWVQNLVDNVSDAFKKRASALPRRPVFDDGNQHDEVVSDDGNHDQLTFLVEETKKGKERESKVNNPPPQFDEFWSIYPRKMSKADAVSAWKALLKNKESIDDILKATKNYAKECEGKETQFVKHPATFLRKERWKDYLSPSRESPNVDPRNKEIEFQKWVQEGNEPDAFRWDE